MTANTGRAWLSTVKVVDLTHDRRCEREYQAVAVFSLTDIRKITGRKPLVTKPSKPVS